MPDHLFRRNRNGKPAGPWIAWGYDAQGDRWQESTRQRDRRAAEARYRELERRHLDPAHARASAASLKSVFELLVEDRESQAAADPPKCSPATVGMYRQKAGTWLRVLLDLYPDLDPFPASRLSPGVVDEVLRRRRRERVKEHTLHKELTTLRAALRLAKRAGLWQGDIEELIQKGFSPGYTPRKRFASSGELPRLLEALPRNGAAMVAFVVATGARRGELFRARREHVAADLSSVHLMGTKTRLAERDVPIEHPSARELLQFALDNGAGEGGALFAEWKSPNHAIKRACVKLKLEHLCFNDLRRTFATWLRQAGVPSALVAPAMGHADTDMVDRVYGQLESSDLARQIRGSLALAAEQAAAEQAARASAEPPTPPPPPPAAPPGGAAIVQQTPRTVWTSADGVDGFETRKAPVTRGLVVGHDRLELSANGLRVRCSTN